MAKVLQTLSVDLVANTASFSDAMTKASQISLSSAKSIQKSFMLVSGAAIAAGTAVAGALAGIVVKATEYASSIELMAQKTNVSTETLSKLAYASTLTGGNLDDLGGMLVKFNKSAADSASGNAKAQAAFAGLGVSVTDSAGRFKPAGDVLDQTISKLSAMPDGLKKTQTEMLVFGKSGAALAPILKVLGNNAAQTASDMKTFGLSMSSETAEGAEHLSQTYERAKLAFTGFGLTIFTTALPALQKLADKVISLAQDGSLQRWATTLGNVVTTAAHAASDALEFLSTHGQTLKHTIEVFIALEVASWLLSINTTAVTAAGGFDILIASVGKAILKMSGLSGLASAAGAAITTVRGTTAALVSLASTEGIVATATYAMQSAWASFTAVVYANPIGIAIGLILASVWAVYKALTDCVAETAKFGDAAVTMGDYWNATIDSARERLHGLKEMLLGMSFSEIKKGWHDFHDEPDFGVRVHQIANARAATTPNSTNAPSPAPLLPQPKPTPGPAKPDPYKAELAKLNQELTNSQLALNAAMQESVDAQRQATEAGKAGLIITELQTKLKRQLSGTEKNAITSAINQTGENEHNTQVVESLRQRTDAAKDALATTQALALVIGAGANAEDAAKRKVDAATLARTLGASASAKYAAALKELFRVEAQSAQEARELAAAREGQDLSQSAVDTDALATATLMGADALEKMNLALKINAAEREHAGDNADVTKQLTDAITAQYAAEQRLRAVQQGQVYTSPLMQYQKALEGIAKASQDATKAGVDVDVQQVWLANREAAMRYQEQLEKSHAVYGSASDGARDFFTDLKNQSVSAASVVHDSLNQAFNGVNENLTKLLTGQKTAWKSFVKDMATSVVKTALQKGEQMLVGAITGSGKQDAAAKLDTTNSKLDTINQSILGMSTAGGAVPSLTSGVASAIGGAASSSGSWLSSAARIFGSLIPGGGMLSGLFGSMFGGHRALGGSVQAGMSYDVGEMGRETFVPKTDGTIVPNNRSGNQFTTNITTAGGVTPEQTKMYVQQALREAHPQFIASAAAHMKSTQQRNPSSHR